MIKINLTPSEAVCLLEALIKVSTSDQNIQQLLIDKLKAAIVDPLEEVSYKKSIDMYRSWIDKESEKIESLQKENESIRLPAERASKKK